MLPPAPGAIDDHRRLAELGVEARRDHARHHVGRPTGRRRNDEPHRPIGIWPFRFGPARWCPPSPVSQQEPLVGSASIVPPGIDFLVLQPIMTHSRSRTSLEKGGDLHDRQHAAEEPHSGQQRPLRLADRAGLHVALRRLRQEQRRRGDPRHPSRHRPRRELPRQLRHVRLGPQRDPDRQGAGRRPSRQGRAGHQVRPDAAAGRRQRRRRQPGLCEGRLRREPQAAGRRRDRSLLPAPRRSLGADRGHGRRHGRAGEGGQGARAWPQRGRARDHPARATRSIRSPRCRANTRCSIASMPRRRSRPRARSASPTSPTRRSAAAC